MVGVSRGMSASKQASSTHLYHISLSYTFSFLTHSFLFHSFFLFFTFTLNKLIFTFTFNTLISTFIFFFHVQSTHFSFHFPQTEFDLHFLLSLTQNSFQIWFFFCHSQHTNSYHHSPLYMSTHKFSRSLFHCLMSSFTFPTLTLISLSISLTSSFSLSVHTLISSFDLHKEFLWKIRRHCCWGILVKLVTHQIWTSIINISYSQYHYDIFDTILYQQTWKK